MTIKIIYHQVKPGVDCPDGLAASWVASKYVPNAELIGCTYQADALPPVEPGDKLIIVDFSFPATTMEAWASNDVDVVVIDHHKTAMDNLAGLSDRILARFDMDECGATLAWKTFFPGEPMPVFLEYVRDRDLWNHALPFTEEIHEATASLGRTFALFDELAELTREQLIERLAPIGEKLLAPKHERIRAIAARHEWQVFKYPVIDPRNRVESEMLELAAIPVVKLAPDGSEDRLTSDICSHLYKTIPDAPFVACITSDGSWSLRSDKNGNDTDVGTIAKVLGGGGHRNSAGFRPAP